MSREPKKRKVFVAWVGLVDGKLSWSILYPQDGLTVSRRPMRANLCELFRTRKAAREIYEDVRRVTISVGGKAPDV